MSENMKLWSILGRTDPSHTKAFKRGGGFSGTAIKPMWSYRRMTEEFGPCGDGWGVDEPAYQIVPAGEGEVLIYCTVSVWYMWNGERKTVFGVGGDKVAGKNKYGLQTDDEAAKKSFTDAVTNALKLIGVGADVHMGMFDDSKYVNTMKQEFADEKPAPAEQFSTTRQEPPRKANGLPEKGWRKDGTRTAYAMKTEHPGMWVEFDRELMECQTVGQLTKLALDWSLKAETDKWPFEWRNLAKEEINERKEVLLNSAPDDDVFPGDLPANGNSYVNNVMAGE